jgi:hypothetical protein
VTGTTLHIDPWVLLRDSTGAVLSFRHRVLSLAISEHATLDAETARKTIADRVNDGSLIVVSNPDVEPSIRTCVECGCTDAFACEGGCSWEGLLVCSRCADVLKPMRSREEIEGDIATAFDLAAHSQLNEALARFGAINAELLLDIREELAHNLASQDAIIMALAGGPPGKHSGLVTAGADLLI